MVQDGSFPQVVIQRINAGGDVTASTLAYLPVGSSSYTYGIVAVDPYNGKLMYPYDSNGNLINLSDDPGLKLLTYRISGTDLQLCDYKGQVLYTIPNYESQNA